jgi:hypothetical protein
VWRYVITYFVIYEAILLYLTWFVDYGPAGGFQDKLRGTVIGTLWAIFPVGGETTLFMGIASILVAVIVQQAWSFSKRWRRG